MSEDKDLKLALDPVREYIHKKLKLANSFIPFMDREGKYFDSDDERGKIDPENSIILLNYKGLTSDEDNLVPEYAASVFAFLQIPAYLYEMAKKKQLGVTPEHVKEVIDQSDLLWGICKKLELDVGKMLEELNGLKFSRIEPDVMREIMNDDQIDGLTQLQLGGMTNLQMKSFNRGFRLYERLQQKARGYARGDDVLRASLLVAIESENFDEQYRSLVDYDLDDILVRAGLIAKREYLSSDVDSIEKGMGEIQMLMGARKQGIEIKNGLGKLNEMLERAGPRPSVLTKFKELVEKNQGNI